MAATKGRTLAGCPVATDHCKAEKQQTGHGAQAWLGWRTEIKEFRQVGRLLLPLPHPLLQAVRRLKDYSYCKRVVLDMFMLHSIVEVKDMVFSVGDLCKWEQNVENLSPARNNQSHQEKWNLSPEHYSFPKEYFISLLKKKEPSRTRFQESQQAS